MKQAFSLVGIFAILLSMVVLNLCFLKLSKSIINDSKDKLLNSELQPQTISLAEINEKVMSSENLSQQIQAKTESTIEAVEVDEQIELKKHHHKEENKDVDNKPKEVAVNTTQTYEASTTAEKVELKHHKKHESHKDDAGTAAPTTTNYETKPSDEINNNVSSEIVTVNKPEEAKENTSTENNTIENKALNVEQKELKKHHHKKEEKSEVTKREEDTLPQATETLGSEEPATIAEDIELEKHHKYNNEHKKHEEPQYSDNAEPAPEQDQPQAVKNTESKVEQAPQVLLATKSEEAVVIPSNSNEKSSHSTIFFIFSMLVLTSLSIVGLEVYNNYRKNQLSNLEYTEKDFEYTLLDDFNARNDDEPEFNIRDI